MKISKTLLLAISAGIISTAASAAEAHSPDAPKGKEKCYGIAKAGKNDCGWSGGSCASTTKKDNEPGAWILLHQGYCGRIAGASLEAPATPKK